MKIDEKVALVCITGIGICNKGYACDACPWNVELGCPWCGKSHSGECDTMKEFCYRDSQWTSRMWNETGTDYIDLSGR